MWHVVTSASAVSHPSPAGGLGACCHSHPACSPSGQMCPLISLHQLSQHRTGGLWPLRGSVLSRLGPFRLMQKERRGHAKGICKGCSSAFSLQEDFPIWQLKFLLRLHQFPTLNICPLHAPKYYKVEPIQCLDRYCSTWVKWLFLWFEWQFFSSARTKSR